jgi:hypothetical protein
MHPEDFSPFGLGACDPYSSDHLTRACASSHPVAPHFQLLPCLAEVGTSVSRSVFKFVGRIGKRWGEKTCAVRPVNMSGDFPPPAGLQTLRTGILLSRHSASIHLDEAIPRRRSIFHSHFRRLGAAISVYLHVFILNFDRQDCR